MDELKLFRQADELCLYLANINENLLIALHHTITEEMYSLSMDIVKHLYQADKVYLDPRNADETYRLRRSHQEVALSKVKSLKFHVKLAKSDNVISLDQFQRINELVSECQKLLGRWIKSDRSKFDTRIKIYEISSSNRDKYQL